MAEGNKKSVVYIHTNMITNKAYIGITCKKNVNDRWHNGNGYNYNPHFSQSIKKYGWDNFEHFVFKTFDSQEEAEHAERLLIKLFQTNHYDYGYNIADGGKGSPLSGENNPYYNRIPEEAVKASVAKRTGVPLTKEHKKDISNGLKGKKKDRAHVEKYAAAQRGVKRGRKEIPVVCLETGVVYPRIKDAAEAIGACASHVSYACKTGKKAAGFSFRKLLNSNDYPKGVDSSGSKQRAS